MLFFVLVQLYYTQPFFFFQLHHLPPQLQNLFVMSNCRPVLQSNDSHVKYKLIKIIFYIYCRYRHQAQTSMTTTATWLPESPRSFLVTSSACVVVWCKTPPFDRAYKMALVLKKTWEQFQPEKKISWNKIFLSDHGCPQHRLKIEDPKIDLCNFSHKPLRNASAVKKNK